VSDHLAGMMRKNLKGYVKPETCLVNFMSSSFLRKATANDVVLLFNWVNDHEARSSALNPEPISFDEHVEWFSNYRGLRDIYIYIIDDVPVGQCRLDYTRPEEAFLDYSIDKAYRGSGKAKSMLSLLLLEVSVDVLIAEVKVDNIASKKTLINLGFNLCSRVKDEVLILKLEKYGK
jgi:RimJ/RimL family protein N-acetyltransferase